MVLLMGGLVLLFEGGKLGNGATRTIGVVTQTCSIHKMVSFTIKSYHKLTSRVGGSNSLKSLGTVSLKLSY